VFFDDESANDVDTSKLFQDEAIYLTLRTNADVACCLLFVESRMDIVTIYQAFKLDRSSSRFGHLLIAS
jgi:hypothetical protein